MKWPNFNRPHQLFFRCIPIIWLAVVILPSKAIDIQLHDTYFVIAYYHWGILFTLLLGGYGLLYWLFRRKPLIKGMIIFHILVTIPSMLVWFIKHGFPIENGVGSYIAESTIRNYLPYLIGILLFLLGQILFVINLLIALFKNHK